MMLNDKKFWIWMGMCAIIPILMGLFATAVLISPYVSLEFSDLLHSENIEVFTIWEVAYLLASALSYRKVVSSGMVMSSIICWGIACPLIMISSFIWAGVRIHDGFAGVAYFMISCISWGFSLFPLLLVSYIFKSFQQRFGA